jgi:hypothetical protein
MKKEKTIHHVSSDVLAALAQARYLTMQAKNIKAVIICASSAGIIIATANAEPTITWQAPITISGTSDVSTLGTYFGSWAPQDGGANNFPVNGVIFQGFSDLPSLTVGPTLDNGYNGFGSPNTPDINYNTILQDASFSNEGSAPATFGWSGMTPGHEYLVEFWVNDGRNIGESRSETISGGTNTSAALSFGSDGSGPGQYIIGTFVADSSGAQIFTLTPFSTGSNPNAQINLFQVRDITPSPTVTWQTPVTISGTSDVITWGTYVGSWAPHDGGANNYPVNGVVFQGFSDLPGFMSGETIDNGYNGFGSPNTSDGNYNTLLQSASFANESTPATFSWEGMTPRHEYLVEIWVNDGRNIGESRSETITGGTNTSAPLIFGSDGSGPGQYIIGTFVADNSHWQTLTLAPYSTGSNPEAQINLLQVRDVTPKITGIIVSGTTLTITATNALADDGFALLESTNIALPLPQWTMVLTNSFDQDGAVNISTNVVSPGNLREFYILMTQH